MSDVPIFRRKNSDVRFQCSVVRSCFSRRGDDSRPQLTIVSRLAGQLTVATCMRVRGANYVIACPRVAAARRTCIWGGRRSGVRRFRYMTISVHTLSVHVFSVQPVSVHWMSISVQSLSVHTKYRYSPLRYIKCQFRYKHRRYKTTFDYGRPM